LTPEIKAIWMPEEDSPIYLLTRPLAPRF